MGRHFFPHVSFPALTRAARQAISPDGSVEFDQETAVVSIMVREAKKRNIDTPCLALYSQNRDLWRRAVATYLDTSIESAKTILMKATFGFALPFEDNVSEGVLPMLQGQGCLHITVQMSYLELRYGKNNCRFHETSPFSVLRRSSILISRGRRFFMNCGSFGQLTAILVHTSRRLTRVIAFWCRRV